MPLEFLPLPTLDALGVNSDDLQSKSTDAQFVTTEWFKAFAEHLRAQNTSGLTTLFADVSPTWRDLLALSWDFRTIAGKDDIRDFLAKYLPGAQIGDLVLKEGAQIQQPAPDITWIHANFTFTTQHGVGSGILRLVPTASANGIQWKAHGVFTNLEGLKNFPEKTGPFREKQPAHGEWTTRRAKEIECAEDPQVIIVGGAQGGLMVAARLKYLGVSALVIEKKANIGDSWRGRYEALSLHDPVWYDHMPYLPFPPTWPVYPAAAKFADWLESYAKILELNVWTSAEAKQVRRDPASGKWIVEVERPGIGKRTFKVNHVVMAIGFRGGIPKMPSYPGMDVFDGPILHSTEHRTAKNYIGKKVVVLGSATSGHDISGDCIKHGVDVTMYQRSGTLVMSNESVLRMLSLYAENGPPTDVADRIDASIPLRVVMSLAQRITKANEMADKEILDRLATVGFQTIDGPRGSGLLGLLWERGGGYYLDQGVSAMIADGKIKLKHGVISRFTKSAIEFEDGSALPADVVVCATGYDEPEIAFRPTLGDLASKLKIWDLDDEGEVNGLWRKSGIPNLWIMMGNLKAGRFHSSHIALQIKAAEEGILPADV